MLASWNRNRLTAKLGIDYPIIQDPLGGLSSQRLTAAVSNFGGLGSFGAHAFHAISYFLPANRFPLRTKML